RWADEIELAEHILTRKALDIRNRRDHRRRHAGIVAPGPKPHHGRTLHERVRCALHHGPADQTAHWRHEGHRRTILRNVAHPDPVGWIEREPFRFDDDLALRRIRDRVGAENEIAILDFTRRTPC